MLYPNPTQHAGMAAKAEASAPHNVSGEASRTLWGDAWKRLRKNKLAIIAAAWIVFVALVAITADLWAPQLLGSPTAADTTAMATSSLLPPSLEHPFGTDVTGRDILVRVIYGARISLTIGLLATAISTVIGLIMGAIAAYYGGIWDTIIMRAADIFLAFPYVLFVLCLIAALGQSITNVFIAIGMRPYTAFLVGDLETDGGGYIVADAMGRTTMPGVFAAGDVRTKELRQVVTAVADGANCAQSASEFLEAKEAIEEAPSAV